MTTAQVRQAVMERDAGFCRIPGCVSHLSPVFGLEMAHLKAKGMGGDHGFRTTTENCLLLCNSHHQGPRSVHSGHLRWTFTDEALGANGPIVWTLKERL